MLTDEIDSESIEEEINGILPEIRYLFKGYPKDIENILPIRSLFKCYPEQIENILSDIHKLFEQNQTNIIRPQKIGEMMGSNWIKLPQKGTRPSARSSHVIPVIDSKSYVFGGEFTPFVSVDNALFSFDTFINEWTFLSPRESCGPHWSYHSMTSDDQFVYVFHGCGNNGQKLQPIAAPLPTFGVVSNGSCGGSGFLNSLFRIVDDFDESLGVQCSAL